MNKCGQCSEKRGLPSFLCLEKVDACLAQLLHGVAAGPHSAHAKEGHAHATKGRPATQDCQSSVSDAGSSNRFS